MATNFHKEKTQPSDDRRKGSDTPIELPKFVGPYKIESLLERGGMSILYLGTHPETRDPTTIKILSPKYLSNTEVVERFLREAEIIAMADHPNIVKLYGHGDWEGGLYIAMEFVQGISLRQYLLQRPLSLKRALEIVIDIAYALCHLHTHGVIHRDLKPENILVTDLGQIKVIDFGIAQLLKDARLQHPDKLHLIGTPVYMSPEQRENPESVSYPSDIYSLGIIAYELVLGKLSHGQLHLSLMPKGLQKILKIALQPDPKDRYHDIVDFITEITNYLNSSDSQKERKVGDALSELSEDLRHAQNILFPLTPPSWPHIEVGLDTSRGINHYGLFYDFLMLSPNRLGVFVGESSAKGAQGLIYTAMIRGMIHTLSSSNLSPEEQLKHLNELILKEGTESIFALNYVILDPDQKRVQFFSCGYGPLWYIKEGTEIPERIETKNYPLGLDALQEFRSVDLVWESGDVYTLNTYGSMTYNERENLPFTDDYLKLLMAEHSSQSPQKMCEAIFRRLRMSAAKIFQERSFALIAFKLL